MFKQSFVTEKHTKITFFLKHGWSPGGPIKIWIKIVPKISDYCKNSKITI